VKYCRLLDSKLLALALVASSGACTVGSEDHGGTTRGELAGECPETTDNWVVLWDKPALVGIWGSPDGDYWSRAEGCNWWTSEIGIPFEQSTVTFAYPMGSSLTTGDFPNTESACVGRTWEWQLIRISDYAVVGGGTSRGVWRGYCEAEGVTSAQVVNPDSGFWLNVRSLEYGAPAPTMWPHVFIQ
jgi:hypothetical protein